MKPDAVRISKVFKTSFVYVCFFFKCIKFINILICFLINEKTQIKKLKFFLIIGLELGWDLRFIGTYYSKSISLFNLMYILSNNLRIAPYLIPTIAHIL